jgi:hypothetical protein
MKNLYVLLIVYLLFSTAVATANSIKSDETYTGKRIFFVTDTESSGMFDFKERYKITTTFNIIYEKDKPAPLKNFIVQYHTNKYDIRSIRPVISFNIDGKTWQLSSSTATSKNNDEGAQITLSMPEPLVSAIMETKGDIAIRFFYKTTDGDNYKDYTISQKFVASVQRLYTQTVKPVIYIQF